MLFDSFCEYGTMHTPSPEIHLFYIPAIFLSKHVSSILDCQCT